MAQHGGSATMYGVLYQLLGTAHWAAKIQLTTPIDDTDWNDARLVIEPAGGGGDIHVKTSGKRIVEQWKGKSDRGAWSLRRIVAEVLPDLYRAVDLSSGAPETEFRFVTEGHRGRWDAAESFFADFGIDPPPADPVAALPDSNAVKFFPDCELTPQTFFRDMVRHLREHRDIRDDSELVCARKLWYLLGRFTLHGDRTVDRLSREVDGFLRPLVTYAEQVEAKRRELCAVLLELASGGDAVFTPQQLLARVNLDNPAFHDWARARGAVLDATTRTLSRWGFRDDLDVRMPIKLSTNRSVCVVGGESGQGKTWQLVPLQICRDRFLDLL